LNCAHDCESLLNGEIGPNQDRRCAFNCRHTPKCRATGATHERFESGAQIGPRIEGGLAEIFMRLQIAGEIEFTGHIEMLGGRVVVGQLQQLNLGGAKVDDGRLYLRFVLHAKQFDAVEIDLGNIACVDAVMA
jgi:hypothetical protein